MDTTGATPIIPSIHPSIHPVSSCLLLDLGTRQHVVREDQHHGDPAQLCDSGHVSALREHRLCLRPLPDPAGKSHPSFLNKSLLTLTT